jgi:hypothetical protein
MIILNKFMANKNYILHEEGHLGGYMVGGDPGSWNPRL